VRRRLARARHSFRGHFDPLIRSRAPLEQELIWTPALAAGTTDSWCWLAHARLPRHGAASLAHPRRQPGGPSYIHGAAPMIPSHPRASSTGTY